MTNEKLLELRTKRRRQLKRLGFDRTKSYKCGTIILGCSQCQPLFINRTPCHETGCPNKKGK